MSDTLKIPYGPWRSSDVQVIVSRGLSWIAIGRVFGILKTFLLSLGNIWKTEPESDWSELKDCHDWERKHLQDSNNWSIWLKNLTLTLSQEKAFVLLFGKSFSAPFWMNHSQHVKCPEVTLVVWHETNRALRYVATYTAGCCPLRGRWESSGTEVGWNKHTLRRTWTKTGLVLSGSQLLKGLGFS